MAARVVCIVGARLNSSRLPRKHLLDLAGKTVIARLIDRLCAVEEIDDLVIATTADDYNADLRTEVHACGAEVFAFEGDVNDLMGRVGAAVDNYDATVVVYVCGDCPLLDPVILSRMIRALVEEKADCCGITSDVQQPCEPVHEGIMVYSRRFWDAMLAAADTPFEREHIGAVYGHSRKVVPDKLITVMEEQVFCTHALRISVDTPSDYRFMRNVYHRWYKENVAETLVSLRWVMQETASGGSITPQNMHVHQKTVLERSPKIAIVTCAGPAYGMGNLKRMVVGAFALQDYLAAGIEMYVLGEEVNDPDLELLPITFISNLESLHETLSVLNQDVIIIDLPEEVAQKTEFSGLKVPVIGIDRLAYRHDVTNAFVPSFYFGGDTHKNVRYGWDSYLLHLNTHQRACSGKSITVLTGGADVCGFGDWLPVALDNALPREFQIIWVQGPFANAPNQPTCARFQIVNGEQGIADAIASADVIFSLYGVSFFECLATGKAVVVSDPLNAAKPNEWSELKKSETAIFVDETDDIVPAINQLLNDEAKQQALRTHNFVKELAKGPETFSKFVRECLPKAVVS